MQGLPSADQIRASLIADDLTEFIKSAWPLVEPGTPLSWNWHIEVVCRKLEAATRGESKRLIINIPPRSMKSLTVGVFWPAWVWLTRPEARFMFATYAEALSLEHAENFQQVINAPALDPEDVGPDSTLLERVGYQGLLRLLGQDWTLVKDAVTKIRNSKRGQRFATSTGARVTGFGGDFQVVDDPHNAEDIHSDVLREKVLRWWNQSMASRLNSQKTGVRVVVMQRLHEQDLTGDLIEKGGWEHVCIPMEYDPAHPYKWDGDPRSEYGELLWPDRWGPDETESLKREHDPYAWAGQYLQLPAPAEGGIFKTAWWQYYPKAWLDWDPDSGEPSPWLHFDRIWQSWDTALKEKTTNDWTVGQLWGSFGPDRYLLWQERGHWGLTEMTERALYMHAWASKRFPRHGSHTVFVENTANGPELVSALRKKLQAVVPVIADTDKVSRAYSITGQLAGKNVYLPGKARMTSNGFAPDPDGKDGTPDWAMKLVAECAAFPNAAHDDQVDALTQALDPRRWNPNAGQQKPNKARPGRSVTGGYSRSNV